jgi:hypothetical protein
MLSLTTHENGNFLQVDLAVSNGSHGTLGEAGAVPSQRR